MSPYQEEAAHLTAALAVARVVVAQVELILWGPGALPVELRLVVGLRGMLCAAASMAISRGMPREEVAARIEDFARRIRSGEAEALGKAAVQALEALEAAENPGVHREKPS